MVSAIWNKALEVTRKTKRLPTSLLLTPTTVSMASSQFKSRYENKPTPENQVATTRSLLDLATEVLIEILAFLSPADMIAVQRTCRTIRDIVADTAYLQYTLRTKINGVDDLLPPDFPYSERLELLRRHEQSWRDLQFHRFAECPDTSRSGVPNDASIALQDSYLIYGCFSGWASWHYGYTDLCSAYQNKELRWVHLKMGTGQFPGLTRVVFAVDHDLVMAASIQQAFGVHTALVELAFFEFSTGAPHPLSSTHTVSLPPLSEFPNASVHAEVLGDHVLISVWNYSCDSETVTVVYLVSWKTGTVTLLRRFRATMPRGNGRSMAVSINSSLVSLIEDYENRLEICKLELEPSPRLQTLCFLELPPLTPGTSHSFIDADKEFVPTSKSYMRTRSSRGYHLPFYSSAIGTIALHFQYQLHWQFDFPSSYALIISAAALISAIPTDVRNIPWEDWGPSNTHFFEIPVAGLRSVGPFWITSRPPPVVRQYDLHTRYTQLMAGDESSLQSMAHNIVSKKVFQYDIKTHLPYCDVMIENKDLCDSGYIVADREWAIGVTLLGLEAGATFIVCHVG